MKDPALLNRIIAVGAALLSTDKLRLIIKRSGFNVRVLAVHAGLEVRTLERRFREQFQTTPKAWLIQERMRAAPALLAEGLSNKEIAASLNYSRESNFCRDFKRCFGCSPQRFADVRRPNGELSRFG